MTHDETARLTVGQRDPALTERLDSELTAFNDAATGGAERDAFSVAVREPDGELVGGLTAWTWGGCLGISLLWVREDARGAGWGSALLRAAEQEGARRGCDRAVVSSFTFQAPDFYRGHGYRETGRMLGLPGGHEDVHLFKRLAAEAG
ncbi:GNAT family N-acetyltransferase [Streptomyces sp. SL13]|uniref:GNAT family N-acetyltransferase n=1 Tax=Streptantibioticus silvisoli TaxID=2705255 RepID=A0AA90K0J2_9ACTN|nr:GNAT family N-acetyltransferase [Streptantibioticus silvisoli]MDI5964749.1 GNAT family N-acetyltransferase [Streptantibioticus silvisoli]MDI5973091.1 GNAT family N-acetyltransferase [Streptantibioticus silvisoli]